MYIYIPLIMYPQLQCISIHAQVQNQEHIAANKKWLHYDCSILPLFNLREISWWESGIRQMLSTVEREITHVQSITKYTEHTTKRTICGLYVTNEYYEFMCLQF